MYLYDRNMATNTNLKYANSSPNYYVIMMLLNTKNSNSFRIPEAQSAELKQTTAKWLLFARYVVKRRSKRSALVLYKLMRIIARCSTGRVR